MTDEKNDPIAQAHALTLAPATPAAEPVTALETAAETETGLPISAAAAIPELFAPDGALWDNTVAAPFYPTPGPLAALDAMGISPAVAVVAARAENESAAPAGEIERDILNLERGNAELRAALATMGESMEETNTRLEQTELFALKLHTDIARIMAIFDAQFGGRLG